MDPAVRAANPAYQFAENITQSGAARNDPAIDRVTSVNQGGATFTEGNRALVDQHALALEDERALSGESLFSEEFFMSLMSRFFMTFTPDNGTSYPYKAHILSLQDAEATAHQTEAEETKLNIESQRWCFSLELTDLTEFSCWDIKGDTMEDDPQSEGASETQLTYPGTSRSRQRAATLYQCFRMQPLKFVPLSERVVGLCYKTLTAKELDLFQLEISDKKIVPKAIRSLNADNDMDHLVLISGIVVAANKSYLKGTQVIAKCRKCGDLNHLKLPYWREGATLPKWCKADNERRTAGASADEKKDKCPVNPYEVVSEFTSYIEIQNLKFQERPEDVPMGDFPRTINVNLSGVHVSHLKPGMRNYLLGVYSNFDSRMNSAKVNESQLFAATIHLLGIFRDPESIVDVARESNPTACPEFTQQEINAFKNFSKRSDLLDVVSDSIAPSIYGHKDVKRSIACMLFGGSRKAQQQGNRRRADIHCLLLGDPSVAKSQFLKYACKVAPRGVYTSGKGSSAAGLTAAIVKDPQGNFALEGGAMVLADGGVVCIDEFDKMRDDDRVAIHEAMEQQTISIAKAGITTVLTTQCSVLSAANPTFGSFDISKDTAEQHDFESTILSRFDLIWLIKDEKNYDRDRKIAFHIFDLFLKADQSNQGGAIDEIGVRDIVKDPEGNDILDINFFKRYLAYARYFVHPKMTKECAMVLENYYVSIRDERRTSTQKRIDQIPITVRQLESLCRISEALAKIHLSPEVQGIHVQEAIRIFNAATVVSAQSVQVREALSEEEIHSVDQAEQEILKRMAINAKMNKFTICKDMNFLGLESKWVQYAMVILIKKGQLKELRDGNVLRVH